MLHRLRLLHLEPIFDKNDKMTSIAKATSRSNFFNVLIGRNHRCDWRSTSIQLLLIVLWHWTAFVGTIDLIKSEIDFDLFELELDVSVAAVGFRFISDFISNSSVKTGIPAVVCCEGLLTFLIFRVVARKLKLNFRRSPWDGIDREFSAQKLAIVHGSDALSSH